MLRGAATVAANGGLPTEGFKVVISKAVNFDCLAEKKEHLEKNMECTEANFMS